MEYWDLQSVQLGLCDRQTDSLTHRKTDFIICSMLLMHWADNRTLKVCTYFIHNTNVYLLMTVMWYTGK